MQATTLSFANLHNYGALFGNIAHARRELSRHEPSWIVPHEDEIDYDQYDTPQSRWLAVHDDAGEVMASLRMTPTIAQCGVYTYLIKDAQDGMLDHIPRTLLDHKAPAEEGIWEITKGFISHHIPQQDRRRVYQRLVEQIIRTSHDEGIKTILALLPANWPRWTTRPDLQMRAAGPVVDVNGVAHQAVWFKVPQQTH